MQIIIIKWKVYNQYNMDISFVNSEPALFIRKEKQLAVSDLHIGLEERLSESGIHLSNAVDLLAGDLLNAYRKSGAKGIIFLGDFKERIMYMTKAERDSMLRFFAKLSGIECRFIRGNHDARLEDMLRSIGIKKALENEILLEKVALMHGNALPSKESMEKDYIAVGHGHFAANINGSERKVWFIAKPGPRAKEEYPGYNRGIKLVILPAFNRAITGTDISRGSEEHMPLLRNKIFDFNSGKIFDLEGMELR